MSGCTVLVCGSRNWAASSFPLRANERAVVFERLDALLVRHDGDLTVIHGNEQGADATARFWLRKWGRDIDGMREQHQAEHERLGPMACAQRNRLMLESLVAHRDRGRVVMAYAFRLPGRSPSIDDMLRRLRAVDIECRTVQGRR